MRFGQARAQDVSLSPLTHTGNVWRVGTGVQALTTSQYLVLLLTNTSLIKPLQLLHFRLGCTGPLFFRAQINATTDLPAGVRTPMCAILDARAYAGALAAKSAVQAAVPSGGTAYPADWVAGTTMSDKIGGPLVLPANSNFCLFGQVNGNNSASITCTFIEF